MQGLSLACTVCTFLQVAPALSRSTGPQAVAPQRVLARTAAASSAQKKASVTGAKAARKSVKVRKRRIR